MSENLVEQLMEWGERPRIVEKGTLLFHEGDAVQTIFVIKDGLVELKRPQIDGVSITLQRASDLAVLAEASVYSSVYHCDAVVALTATVVQLSKTAFLAHLKEDQHFSELWSVHLAKEVQAARYRSEILSKKTVRERLDAWMAFGQNEMPEKGSWKAVAAQLGVSPEALYRELSRRK